MIGSIYDYSYWPANLHAQYFINQVLLSSLFYGRENFSSSEVVSEM